MFWPLYVIICLFVSSTSYETIDCIEGYNPTTAFFMEVITVVATAYSAKLWHFSD